MTGLTMFAVTLLAAVGADAEARTLTFDNVTYERRFVSHNETLDLAEYLTNGETLENWTTLVAVRRFPELDDPARAAAEVIKVLQKSNPLARFAFLTKQDESEAMIDFITWPPDASYAEFNVFRYLKSPDSPGLICYQFAYRFRDSSPENAAKIREQRAHWVEEMSRAELPIDFVE